jgi:hypothetical protein
MSAAASPQDVRQLYKVLYQYPGTAVLYKGAFLYEYSDCARFSKSHHSDVTKTGRANLTRLFVLIRILTKNKNVELHDVADVRK